MREIGGRSQSRQRNLTWETASVRLSKELATTTRRFIAVRSCPAECWIRYGREPFH